MMIELHAIQNFVPANLNRDDTGTPKNCQFGGVRRARISSQCFKRAMRDAFRDGGLLNGTLVGTRTKRLANSLIARLTDTMTEDDAALMVNAAMAGLKLKLDKDRATEYLLFVSSEQIEDVADRCAEAWRELDADGTLAKARGKKDATVTLSGTVQAAIKTAMQHGQSADIALFGRMVANTADINVDAAAQVAHSISTNKVDIEFDYYTAVDDLNPKEDTGAGMIGTIEFNSACFYRYANVDLEQLTTNLDGDTGTAQQTLEAYVRAFVTAVPSGKQNSMAAHNPPSLVFAVARERGNWSLANAFVKPVAPTREGDLVGNSITALDKHWGDLAEMYGTRGIVGQWCVTLDKDGLTALEGARVENFDALIAGVLGAARFPNVATAPTAGAA